MTIIWYGQSCFQIISSKRKEANIKIVIDPFDETLGLKVPKLEADILLITHQHHDHNNIKAVSGNSFIINNLGEYEIEGVFIQGISSFHDNVLGKERGLNIIYTMETEEIRLCHLGDLGQKELNPKQLEKIGEVDILMLPAGGTYTIGSKEASKIISQIEPRIIIPMHYQIPRLKLKLEGADKFLKAVSQKSVEPLVKLSIKKKEISLEEVKTVILKPQ